MTKDGRPSLLNDIRYFYGSSWLGNSYLKDREDVVAFGRRIALFLNGESVSLGAYSALYLQFNPNLKLGEIKITEDGGDWWQRYTYVGVPSNFLEMANASEFAISATTKALKAIRKDLSSKIERASRIVEEQGENLRFLIRSHQSKQFVVEVSCNIAEWKSPSYLCIGLTDRQNGEYLEAAPVPLKFYQDAFHLAGSIKIDGLEVSVLPKTSFSAQFTANNYANWLSKPVSEFTQIEKRPVLSGLIKLRG